MCKLCTSGNAKSALCARPMLLQDCKKVSDVNGYDVPIEMMFIQHKVERDGTCSCAYLFLVGVL